MILFVDTETTGLPDNWNAPVTNTKNWPRLVQIAYLLYDANGQLVERKSHIINPKGFSIPHGASAIHGITTGRAISEGVELDSVLYEFKTVVAKASLLVAHNIAFDEKIVGCEFYRITGRNYISRIKKFCTMKNPAIVNFCAIPPFKFGSYKWPKLSELHYKLFGANFDEAHNAAADIEATARCFWKLNEKGVIYVSIPKKVLSK